MPEWSSGKPKWYDWVLNPIGSIGPAIGNAVVNDVKQAGVDAIQNNSDLYSTDPQTAMQAMANLSSKERAGIWSINRSTGALDWSRQLAQNAWEANEAAKTRDWQKMMSDTSLQRGAADALAAGYNPAMVMTQGGASTPSGATARASGSVPRSGEDITRVITNIFGVVGSLIAAGMKTSAMEAAQDIRGQYTIDAAKLKGNNALVVAKTYTDAGKHRAILNNQAAMERIKEWKKGPEKSEWYKKYLNDLDKAYRSDKRAMKKERDKELEALEHIFD